jgi:lipase chaperone LimK
MGKLTKTKIDEIARLRQEGYTQKEIAQKAKVHLRTVRKYDPLRTQKPRITPEQVKETEESCRKLAAEGLAYETNGRFGISLLGRKVQERFKELRQLAILEFMVEADRPVSEAEIERHLHGICEQLFQQAIDEVKSRQD